MPKTCPRPVVPAHKGKTHDWRIAESSLRPQCADSVLAVCSTARKTEQTHSTRCQFWDWCWENQLDGSMIALKRVARYMKGTIHFVNKLELDADVDKRT